MISPRLLEIVRCPTCLEVQTGLCRGSCSGPCVVVCPQGALDLEEGVWFPLKCNWCLDCVLRCPHAAIDKAGLTQSDDQRALSCSTCGTEYPIEDGYVDLLPRRDDPGHTSKYSEEELEQSLDYQSVAPPFLGAAVRNDVLNSWLGPNREPRTLDIGCGNGKFVVWNRERCGYISGVDGAALFATEALREIDLVQGDIRWLPYASGAFDFAFSIDVMEHLVSEDIASYFTEARRVLTKSGRLLLYSNTREKSRLHRIISAQKRLSGWLVRRGYYNFERDQRRKADHVKAIRTFEELEDRLSQSGLSVDKKLFWNGVFQGFIDNIVIKLAEARMGRKMAKGKATQSASERELAARARARVGIARSARYRLVLTVLTKLMKLDLLLFGRLRSGPFFVLVKRTEA